MATRSARGARQRGSNLAHALEMCEPAHALDEAEVAGGVDLRDGFSHPVRVRDTEEAVVEAVVEEDRPPDTHAAAEAVEIALGALVRAVAVDEHEVERAGVDLHRARVRDEDLHR